MIRRTMLLTFRPDVSAALISEILADLFDIKAKLPGRLAIASGRSESPEMIKRGYQHGFVIDVRDSITRAVYPADAGHSPSGVALFEAAIGGLDGILVFDLAMASTASAS